MEDEAITNKRDDRARKNEEITVSMVRLIGADGSQLGVVSFADALDAAGEAGLDLVEISPSAKPYPVCKIMDYGKYRFEQDKKNDEAKKKQKQIQVKELKFRPTTEEGDYQVKLRNLLRFLANGDKVKITLRFRGREMAHQELGMKIMDKLLKDTEEFAAVEQQAKREGRQLTMVLSPKKK